MFQTTLSDAVCSGAVANMGDRLGCGWFADEIWENLVHQATWGMPCWLCLG